MELADPTGVYTQGRVYWTPSMDLWSCHQAGAFARHAAKLVTLHLMLCASNNMQAAFCLLRATSQAACCPSHTVEALTAFLISYWQGMKGMCWIPQPECNVEVKALGRIQSEKFCV